MYFDLRNPTVCDFFNIKYDFVFYYFILTLSYAVFHLLFFLRLNKKISVFLQDIECECERLCVARVCLLQNNTLTTSSTHRLSLTFLFEGILCLLIFLLLLFLFSFSHFTFFHSLYALFVPLFNRL